MYCKTGERFMKARTIYNKNGNQNKKEAAAGAGVTESILSNIENDDIDRDVGCSHVIALANYYGVTTDYLLGLSNAPTNDESVISAVSFTGLSVETVNKLNRFKNDESHPFRIDMINSLFEKRQIAHLFDIFIRLKKSADDFKRNLKEYDCEHVIDSHKRITLSHSAVRYGRFELSEYILKIADEMFNMSDINENYEKYIDDKFEEIRKAYGVKELILDKTTNTYIEVE